MEIILVSLIVLLGMIIALQHYQKRQIEKGIKYITQKLEEIIANDSLERVKLFTPREEVKGLVAIINAVLDYNHKNKMKYNKTRQSMKKMLSNISHDLKTPLTVILGYTEMLQATGKEKDMVDKIYLKATEVLELINQFFDLAKLESGDKQFPITKVNIGELCKVTLLDFYSTLSNEGIEVVIDIPEKNIYALGNAEAIRRILNNLISNAAKYGKDGGFLGLTLREEETFIRIDVIDKGKGIEEQYKEEVFERIFTLEDSRSKAYQGSGLGLTITKHLVETLGGEIYLKSIPNERTVFSFILHRADY
ncbi:MAG: sensor histidine kinase [Cellulosilyticaceae bacterium]